MTVRDALPAEPLPLWIQRYVEETILPNQDRYSAKHCCNHTHVAFVCKRRKVIAVGHNRVKSRGPFSMIHAEADAIQSLDVQQLRGATLVVIRVSPHGLKYSRPCEACQRLLAKCRRDHGLGACFHS
jgi:cytidine deaminase